MEELIGTSLGVFLGITVMIMGFAAFMTGQAIANAWHPVWQAVIYCFLLTFADRFLIFALFEGELSSLGGFVVDALVLIGIGVLAYRLTLARRMVSQYPWIYERAGIFGWRDKSHK
jgi:ABC-type uncharacterized transport system permease subunit